MSTLLMGQPAPTFSTNALVQGKIVPNFSLGSLLGKYVIFFFYPLDFTFVCPTELHAFQESLSEFQKRGAEVVACSVDSCYSHLAWTNTPKASGGIEGVSYPIVSDLTKEIARNYQVLDEKAGIAYRGLFVIDPEGIIRYEQINDLPIGRSVSETLRILDALIFHKNHGEVCPANWKKGEKTMKANSEGLVEFFK
ncbi:MAG: peroxiredoxin [Verrucomicrobia bacterium]|nr:peroxiredoxin [Verrucomicrobiota bacterium]